VDKGCRKNALEGWPVVVRHAEKARELWYASFTPLLFLIVSR
jgi:hypothetical protein